MQQAISILAPTGRDARVIHDILSSARIASRTATDMGAVIQDLVGQRSGTLLLAEEALTPDAVRVLQTWLDGQPPWSDLPIILMRRRRDVGAPTLPSPDRLGQVTVLERPFHPTTLVAAARAAIRTRDRQLKAEAQFSLLERRRKDLEEERDRTRRYLDVAGVMLLVLDRDAVVREINRRGVEILGYDSAEAIVGRDWFELAFAPDERDAMRARFRRLMSGELQGVPDHDDPIRRPDGGLRCIAWRHSVLHDPDGRIAGTLSSGEDITARQAAEDDLRRLAETLESRVQARTADLAASEARFRGLFDSSFQFAALLAPDGTVQEVNQTALAWSEIDAETMVGRPFWEAPPMRARSEVRNEIQSAVRRAAAGAIVRRELELAGAGQDRAIVDFSLKPILGSDGVILALVAEGRDVTEFRQAQAHLHESAKIETLGQLTGGVAHDFNNLLTPIVGALDLIHRRTELEPRLQQLLEGAQLSAERATTLVQRLLSFARRQHLQARTVDVADLLLGMEDLIRRTIGPHIDVEVSRAVSVPPAFIDPNQLELAVLNLVVNARDAMGEGGRIAIALAERGADPAQADTLSLGRYVVLCVQDSGAGMDADTLKRAIEPFFTTKAVGKGTGLGLSMVHGLAAQSGGALQISSVPGEGTRAEIWLPVSHDDKPVLRDEQARPIPAARPSCLLVVDDEPLVRAATEEMLKELGHRVVAARGGQEALDILAERRDIDGLVTDHLMPQMQGRTLIARARCLRPDLPCLLVTGFAETLDEGDPGSFARLSKPFTARELAAELARLFPPDPDV